jgi:hypothetical protein
MGSWRQHTWAWSPWRMATACRRPRIRRTRSRVPSNAGGTISTPGKRQASMSKWEQIIFCFRAGSAQLSLAWRRTLSERRKSMRVPAILLMGIVLSACVSAREPPSQPVPPANLGATQAAPPVPPAPLPAGLPPGYTRHITYRDGRFTLPDGSTVPAASNGGFTISTGAYIPPDGAGGVILPNGARCISDSARGYFCP